MERMLNVQELSEKLGVPKTWIYERTRRKEIPFVKLGRYCLFRPKEIENWLRLQSKGADNG